MGVVGGPASTFNPYLYVRGNPVNWTDPSGRIAPLVAAGLYVVTDTISHVDQTVVLLTLDGETLTTTAEHPFYTISGEWVNAGDLEIGDEVVSLDGNGNGTVESIVVVVDPQPMYNLTVDEAHTYFVGDGEWLVHNCPRQMGFDEIDDNFPQRTQPSLVGLQPNELQVGTHGTLYRANDRAGIVHLVTPHHGPADSYMRALGLSNYSYSRGIAINLSVERHMRTRTLGGRLPPRGLTPRAELARDVADVRRILIEDGLYDDYARQQLQLWIKTNKTAFAGVFGDEFR